MKTKGFVIGAGVASLIAAYAVAGFIVAPRLVRSALLSDLPQIIDVTPTMGAVHINPFLFRATVDDFALTGAHGEKLLGFERLYVDFRLSSIWHRAYTFGNIAITAPFASAVVSKDGALNLLELRPKRASNPKPTTPTLQDDSHPLPALRIDSFKVSRGLLTYEDRSRPDPFAARLEPIDFELRDFSTGVEGGRFTFTGASKLGERVKWHGHLSVDPIESDGEFQIDGLLAHTLWEYLQDQLNFVIDSGSIDVAASYRFSLKDAGSENLQVDLSRIALTNLTVRPKEAVPSPAPAPVSGPAPDPAPLPAPWITVPSLIVTGTAVDVAKRQAHVERVDLRGLQLTTWRDADGSVNLQKLAAPPVAAAPGTPVAAPAKVTAPNVTSSGGSPGPAWVFDLRQFDVEDASLSAEDRTVQPAARLLLAPWSLQVTGASQDLAKPVTVAFGARVNGGGSVAVSGDVTVKPALANLRVNLKDVELTALQPYIAQQTAMTLLGGTLGVDGNVHVGAVGKSPALQFTGNVSVLKLHTVDDALQDDFINWDRLDILGLDYSQGPDHLNIDQILARRLYARVIIESDASMNVKRVLKIPVATPAGVAHAPMAAAAGARKSPAAPTSSGMPMSIRRVVIHESQADFADFSVEPNFATGIQKLEGTLVALSSAPGSRAKVDLTGALDTFSPVSITGDVNLLGPLYTDLTLSFRNISLPVLDPYSGKFAGYDIAKGKLSTELHYKVDGRRLDAQHHIVVEQLEFGEKTVSKEAVALPVKLAVALLKDRNGVIDLNIPVSGSLDDPEFRLGPLFGKVLIDIVEHAITAPFELLGSLFGGGPDLQFIDFEPGMGTLDAPAMDKAKTVARALIERPQLKIDVPIAVVPELDRPALRAMLFDAQLRAAVAAGGAQKPAGTAPTFERLDPETQVVVLSKLYATAFGAQPRFPETVTSLKSKPDIIAAKRDFLSQALRDHVVVGDDELQSLGQRRAMALQQALLSDPQVAAERVFLVANDKAVASDGAVRLELSLK
jgi:hypothetical protein